MLDPREVQPSGAPPHFYNHATILGVLYALPFLLLLLIGLPLGALLFPEYAVALACVSFTPAIWANVVFLRQISRVGKATGLSPPGASAVRYAPMVAAVLFAICLILATIVAVRIGTFIDKLGGRSEQASNRQTIPIPQRLLTPPAPRSDRSGIVVGQTSPARNEIDRIYVARTSLMYYSAPPSSPRQTVEIADGPVFFRVLSTESHAGEEWYQIRITPVRGQQFLAWISDNALRIANPEPLTEQQAQAELTRLRGGN
jgi:hypothetical protein